MLPNVLAFAIVSAQMRDRSSMLATFDVGDVSTEKVTKAKTNLAQHLANVLNNLFELFLCDIDARAYVL